MFVRAHVCQTLLVQVVVAALNDYSELGLCLIFQPERRIHNADSSSDDSKDGCIEVRLSPSDVLNNVSADGAAEERGTDGSCRVVESVKVVLSCERFL